MRMRKIILSRCNGEINVPYYGQNMSHDRGKTWAKYVTWH